MVMISNMPSTRMQLIWALRSLNNNPRLFEAYEEKLLHDSKLHMKYQVRGVELDVPRIRFEDLTTSMWRGIRRHYQPVVIEGLGSRAVKECTPDWFAENYGDTNVPVVSDHEDDPNVKETRFIPLRDAVEAIQKGEPAAVAACAGIFHKHKELLDYTPIENLRSVIKTNLFHHDLWISGPSVRSSLHSDGPDNLVYQVYGQKKWTLISPDASVFLRPDMGARKQGMMYKSQAHKELLEHTTRHTTILSPGDLLYVPAWWWHEVDNLSESIAFGQKVQPCMESFSKNPWWAALIFIKEFHRFPTYMRKEIPDEVTHGEI